MWLRCGGQEKTRDGVGSMICVQRGALDGFAYCRANINVAGLYQFLPRPLI